MRLLSGLARELERALGVVGGIGRAYEGDRRGDSYKALAMQRGKPFRARHRGVTLPAQPQLQAGPAG